MITRPVRQAPIGEVALKSGAETNYSDKNLSHTNRKAINQTLSHE
jgi:hypothetical protein